MDIEGSTHRANPIKAKLRIALYELLEQSLRAGGLTDHHRDPLIDRGDGVLALIRPVGQASKTLLVDGVVPHLATLLAKHNSHYGEQRFRLRAVVHVGEVHYDHRGCFGEALDVAFRLLDAPEVKRTLRLTNTPLVLVVSDDIHRSIAQHGYAGIDGHVFEPLVFLQIGERKHRGWVRSISPGGAENAPQSIIGGLTGIDPTPELGWRLRQVQQTHQICYWKLP